MFEPLEERVRRRVEAIVRRCAEKAAERLRDALPPGISAEAGEDGVRLEGRGLRRRLALQPALRALLARLR